jgi:hypothetical protein
MLVCPKCGFKEGRDWPKILWILSFVVLYATWIAEDFIPRHGLRFHGAGALLTFALGLSLSALRGIKHGRQHQAALGNK